MTDLERHVNAPGRAKLVKEVREKINELGITYIYFNLFRSQDVLLVKGFLLHIGKEQQKKDFN